MPAKSPSIAPQGRFLFRLVDLDVLLQTLDQNIVQLVQVYLAVGDLAQSDHRVLVVVAVHR